MKKISIRFLSIALTLGMALSFVVPTWADEGDFGQVRDDVYKELDEALEGIADSEYDGFIVGIRDDISLSAEKKIDKAVAKEDGIGEVAYTDSMYLAEDVETIKDTIDEKYIEYIEPNYYMSIADGDEQEPFEIQSASNPNDEKYSSQYNLKNLKVSSAWSLGFEGQDLDGSKDNIVIAVLDTGIVANHEDLNKGQLLPATAFVEKSNKYVQSSSSADCIDKNGHGTRVTGIIAATKDNSVGIAGIMPQAKILPVKVTKDSTGEAPTLAVAAALNYLTAQKYKYNSGDKSALNICVVNISLGTTSYSETVKTACENAMKVGIIVVSAAGNVNEKQQETAVQYPAQFTMGVAAVDKDNCRWEKSLKINSSNGEGYLNKVWVSAPGVSIPSTKENGNYAAYTGTSFACPEVAALAALCKSIHNDMTQQEFMTILKQTSTIPSGISDYINGTRQSETYGWGIVDYDKVIKSLIKTTTTKATCTTAGKTVITCNYKNCGTKLKETTIAATGHKYGSWIKLNDIQHQRVCSNDKTHIEKENHSWDSGKITKAATTTATGIKTYTCTVCKGTKTETIPKVTTPTVPSTGKKSIANATVSGISNKSYTGKALTQNLTVKLSSTTLKNGTDYTVSYKNNIKVGTATITITGKGNYTGTITKTFKINSAVQWERVFGTSKYKTAYEVANSVSAKKKNYYDNIIVVNRDNPADAISSGYLSKVKNAPILLWNKDVGYENGLVKNIKNYMKSGGTVYVMGGKSVIPDSFIKKLNDTGLKAKRVSGKTKYDTNIDALNLTLKVGQNLIVISNSSRVDSVPANAVGEPLMMVDKKALTANQVVWLKKAKPKTIYIIGNEKAITTDLQTQLKKYCKNVERIAGANTIETSKLVADRFFKNAKTIVLVKNYADGLVAPALARKYNAPILLITEKNYGSARNYIASKGVTKAFVVGGANVISDKTVVATLTY